MTEPDGRVAFCASFSWCLAMFLYAFSTWMDFTIGTTNGFIGLGYVVGAWLSMMMVYDITPEY